MAARGQPPRVAVVGAAGTVGSQLVELLDERAFPYRELKLFGRPARPGEILRDEPGADVFELKAPEELATFDLVFLATPAAAAAALRTGGAAGVTIDLSAANRAPDDNQPLVAPGLFARERLKELQPNGRFGIPHPAAQVIASILASLGVQTEFAGASVLLGASGGGRQMIAKLFNQSADLLNARLDLADDETQSAFNLFLPPDAGDLSEILAAQVAALSGHPAKLAIQVARAPIFHGTAVALFLPYRDEMPQWATRLRATPGLVLVESGESSGTIDATGQDAVIVKLVTSPAGASLWCVFDSARLAALAAVWLAEIVSA